MAKPTREEVAKDLARWHFTVEPALTKILWIGPANDAGGVEPLRFVEVAPQRAGMDRGIEVFTFDATKDVPFPSEVAEVTERELTLVAGGVLSLPEGWDLEGAKVFTREDLGAPAQAREVG